MSKEKAFNIPSQSIVKADQSEGSAEWMKKIAKEHGDTSPQKLEKRREKLSVYANIMHGHLKNLQIQKKVAFKRNKKTLDECIEKLGKMDQKSADFSNLSAHIANIQLEMQSQETTFDLMIQQAMSNEAHVEGLCLIVDSLTLREPVTSKNGKKGMLRFSGALYMSDAAYYTTKLYNRMKKLYELMAAQSPLLAGATADDNDDGVDSDSEIEDEDIVNEDDRKKIAKEVEDVDL